MIKDIIADSTCLIALDRIGRLGILSKSFKKVYIPPGVEKEFGKKVGWIIVRPAKSQTLVKALLTQIDAGESEVIALALEMKKSCVILDDKKARRIAKDLGLKMLGTIGVLLQAKKIGVISKIKPALDDLNATGFYISTALYNRALKLARE